MHGALWDGPTSVEPNRRLSLLSSPATELSGPDVVATGYSPLLGQIRTRKLVRWLREAFGLQVYDGPYDSHEVVARELPGRTVAGAVNNIFLVQGEHRPVRSHILLFASDASRFHIHQTSAASK